MLKEHSVSGLIVPPIHILLRKRTNHVFDFHCGKALSCAGDVSAHILAELLGQRIAKKVVNLPRIDVRVKYKLLPVPFGLKFGFPFKDSVNSVGCLVFGHLLRTPYSHV